LSEDKTATIPQGIIQALPQVYPLMQEVGMLQLRIKDMMTQLNTVVKTMTDENAALKAKQQ
jgi:hypothetical protein